MPTGFFESQVGVGVAFAHRLNTAIPMALVGGYGNGGGTEHTGMSGLWANFERKRRDQRRSSDLSEAKCGTTLPAFRGV